MPLENFMRLKLNERKEILETACRQLANEPCDKLRAGRPGDGAPISGSEFYPYFYNRRDLLRCLQYYLYDSVLGDFLCCLQAEEGDFQEACIRAVGRMKEEERWEIYASLCRRFTEDEEYQETAADTAREYRESGKVREFIGACYEMLAPEKYGALEREKLECGLMLVGDIVLYALFTYEADSTDGEWEALLRRLQSIGQGLQKLSSEQKKDSLSKKQAERKPET